MFAAVSAEQGGGGESKGCLSSEFDASLAIFCNAREFNVSEEKGWVGGSVQSAGGERCVRSGEKWKVVIPPSNQNPRIWGAFAVYRPRKFGLVLGMMCLELPGAI